MKCPGQDMKYWKAGAIFDVPCPTCGSVVEFYKDDTSRKCGSCGNRFVNPKMDFGCASYCQYAEQCLGTLPEEYTGQQDNLLKDKVAVEMKRYYKSDFQRIGHAIRVASHAEQIGRSENANLAVILCAAYLKNIGTSTAEEKYDTITPEHIGQESRIIAETILTKLGAKSAIIQEVCSLIAYQTRSNNQISIESQVVADAEKLALLEEQHKDSPIDTDNAEQYVTRELVTDSGRQRAREVIQKLAERKEMPLTFSPRQ